MLEAALATPIPAQEVLINAVWIITKGFNSFRLQIAFASAGYFLTMLQR
jgi:hypothetical protein